MAAASPIDGSMAGQLYFSKKQWDYLRSEGKLRTFAMNAGQQIIEYTEMITFDDLKETPVIAPIFDDAESRGIGFFHHREDGTGNWK